MSFWFYLCLNLFRARRRKHRKSASFGRSHRKVPGRTIANAARAWSGRVRNSTGPFLFFYLFFSPLLIFFGDISEREKCPWLTQEANKKWKMSYEYLVLCVFSLAAMICPSVLFQNSFNVLLLIVPSLWHLFFITLESLTQSCCAAASSPSQMTSKDSTLNWRSWPAYLLENWFNVILLIVPSSLACDWHKNKQSQAKQKLPFLCCPFTLRHVATTTAYKFSSLSSPLGPPACSRRCSMQKLFRDTFFVWQSWHLLTLAWQPANSHTGAHKKLLFDLPHDSMNACTQELLPRFRWQTAAPLIFGKVFVRRRFKLLHHALHRCFGLLLGICFHIEFVPFEKGRWQAGFDVNGLQRGNSEFFRTQSPVESG